VAPAATGRQPSSGEQLKEFAGFLGPYLAVIFPGIEGRPMRAPLRPKPDWRTYVGNMYDMHAPRARKDR